MNILLLIACLASGFVFASGGGEEKAAMKKELYGDFKQEKLKHMDARIKIMQETRDCVGKTNNHKEAKECHKGMKGKMKVLRDANKGKMEALRKKRKEKRSEMKKKKQAEKAKSN